MVKYGTPPTTPQAATLNSASRLGWAKGIEQPKPGCFVDSIVVPDDPLADIGALEHARFAMKNGVIARR